MELIYKLSDLKESTPAVVKSYEYNREGYGNVRVELSNRLFVLVSYGEYSEVYFGCVAYEYSEDESVIDSYIDIECSTMVDTTKEDPLIPLSITKQVLWHDLGREYAL